MRRIGILTSSDEGDPEAQAGIAAFRDGLTKLGWAEGRNLAIDIRWTKADAELMTRSAKELAALQPDLILTSSTPAAGVMLQQDADHSDRFRAGRRPRRQPVRREPAAARR